MEGKKDLHIGNMIRQVLKKQGRSITWFANELHCCRTNVYLIFDKQHVDTALLLRISQILHYNFFTAIGDTINQKEQLL